jgi:dipeptidyl aminopeptidase/acylaminoacyl peptidase
MGWLRNKEVHMRVFLRDRVAGAGPCALVAAASLIMSVLVAPVQAAHPGANGKIAYESAVTGNDEIFAMGPDGSAQTNVSNSPDPDRDPAWSPDGTKIAFSRIGAASPDAHANVWVMDADGSNQVNLTPGSNDNQGNTGTEPAWSPDGAKIAYVDNSNVWVMNSNGTGKVRLTVDAGQVETSPAWSPDGAKIAFFQQSDIWVMDAVGGNEVQLTSTAGAAERYPDWSPDGTKIVYERGGQIWSMNGDGSGQAALTGGTGEAGGSPAWSPDGSKVVFASNAFEAPMGHDIFVMNADGNAVTRLDTPVPASDLDPNWQPLAPAAGYARPRAATPLNVQLVPAFEECTSPSGSHGAPLASSACGPPIQSSVFLTLNAPDRSAPFNAPANATAFLKLRVFCTDGATPPCNAAVGDQQDVAIQFETTDTRCVAATGGCTAAGGAYSGKVLASTTMRITDRLNGVGQGSPGTVIDNPFTFGVQCAAGACSGASSFDAVIPGMVQEQKRAVWQLGQVEVLDGGSDGDLVAALSPASGICPPACARNDDEAVYLRQGLLAP